MIQKNTAAAWMVIGAGVLWGMIALFVRSLQAAGMTSLQIVFFRNLLAAVLLGIVLFCKDKRLLHVHWKDIWMFLGTGMISIALFNYCYFVTLSQSSVAAASLLLYTSPVFIMILSAILFREHMTGQKLLALVITIAGCAFITGVFSQTQRVAFPTVLTGLGSGLFYGLYSIFGKFALKKYNAETVSFYTFVIAALATAPFGMSDCIRFTALHPEGFLTGLGLAMVSTVFPFLLYTGGLNGMQASKAAILATIEPLTASLLGVAVFHDPFTIWTLLGMIFIFGAIGILQLPQPEQKEVNHG